MPQENIIHDKDIKDDKIDLGINHDD